MRRFMLIVILFLFMTGCSSKSPESRGIDVPSELIGMPSQIHIVVDAEEKIIEPGTEEFDEILELLEGRFGEEIQTAQQAILWADKNGFNWDMMCEQFDFLALSYDTAQTVEMNFKDQDAADRTIIFQELIFPLTEYTALFFVDTQLAGLRCYGPLEKECVEELLGYAQAVPRPETESAAMQEQVKEHERSNIPNEAAKDFCSMAQGVWVDLSDCARLEEDTVVFSYYLFADGGIGFGGYSDTGNIKISKVVDAVSDEEGRYLITLYYPEEVINGRVFRESSADFELQFTEDCFYAVEDPERVYTFLGKDLEEAKQNVIQYCREMKKIS